MSDNRKFCTRCGGPIQLRTFDHTPREYCPECELVFYNNPLPVVSSVVVNDSREILLVLRDRDPEAGKWCLPSGFVEIDESIEDAVLRELAEETGVRGKVLRLLDTVSYTNETYGDLIWVSFEVNQVSGEVIAGDDAREARFFPIHELPPLAFPPNDRAVKHYLDYYHDIWKMNDSFRRLDHSRLPDKELPSDNLFEIITKDAKLIADNWISEILSHPTTGHYNAFDREEIYDRAHQVIAQFGDWMKSPRGSREHVWKYYRELGATRRQEKFKLSEVLSALSLTRKHIFAHVLAQGGIWEKPMDMYRIMEFMFRVNLFFDKANHNISVGYESSEKIIPRIPDQ